MYAQSGSICRVITTYLWQTYQYTTLKQQNKRKYHRAKEQNIISTIYRHTNVPPRECHLLDVILAVEYNYSTIVPACLAPFTNVRKGGASNKY